jgi:hypothetical protein
MAKYLIEVPHKKDVASCAQAVEVFLSSGSHFLSNADWGCMDGHCSAWFIAEVDSKEEARQIVPPVFRRDAVVVALNKFTMEQVDRLLDEHQVKATRAETQPAAMA